MKWNVDAVFYGLQFCQQVTERFPAMDSVTKNNFTETTVYLMLALGRVSEAFALLDQLIKEHPNSAQGYAVKADLLTFSATRFNLRPDIEQARQLFLQAQERTIDCDDWDVKKRLKDLRKLYISS